MTYLLSATALCFISVRCLRRSYLIWVRETGLVTRTVSVLYMLAATIAAVLAYYVILEWI